MLVGPMLGCARRWMAQRRTAQAQADEVARDEPRKWGCHETRSEARPARNCGAAADGVHTRQRSARGCRRVPNHGAVRPRAGGDETAYGEKALRPAYADGRADDGPDDGW